MGAELPGEDRRRRDLGAAQPLEHQVVAAGDHAVQQVDERGHQREADEPDGAVRRRVHPADLLVPQRRRHHQVQQHRQQEADEGGAPVAPEHPPGEQELAARVLRPAEFAVPFGGRAGAFLRPPGRRAGWHRSRRSLRRVLRRPLRRGSRCCRSRCSSGSRPLVCQLQEDVLQRGVARLDAVQLHRPARRPAVQHGQGRRYGPPCRPPCRPRPPATRPARWAVGRQ